MRLQRKMQKIRKREKTGLRNRNCEKFHRQRSDRELTAVDKPVEAVDETQDIGQLWITPSQDIGNFLLRKWGKSILRPKDTSRADEKPGSFSMTETGKNPLAMGNYPLDRYPHRVYDRGNERGHLIG